MVMLFRRLNSYIFTQNKNKNGYWYCFLLPRTLGGKCHQEKFSSVKSMVFFFLLLLRNILHLSLHAKNRRGSFLLNVSVHKMVSNRYYSYIKKKKKKSIITVQSLFSSIFFFLRLKTIGLLLRFSSDACMHVYIALGCVLNSLAHCVVRVRGGTLSFFVSSK